MNWLTKFITVSEKIRTAIRKRASKSEIAASKYMSCHGVPVEKKIIEQNNLFALSVICIIFKSFSKI